MNENVKEQYMDKVEVAKQIRCQMMLGSQSNVGRAKMDVGSVEESYWS
jgi:hypothetical protein